MRGYFITFEGGEGSGVVRFVGDFADQFAVEDAVVFIEHDNGACRDAGQRTGGDGNAVGFQEISAAHGRQRQDVVQSFGTAEAALSEGKVGGNAEDDGVGGFIGALVELAYRGCAGRCVDAREDIQDLALAGQAGQADVGQVLADQRECRSLVALDGKAATDFGGVAAKGYGSCHIGSPGR